MKGKMLTFQQLKNMNEQYVYILPFGSMYENEEGKAKVIINDDNGIIKFRPNFAVKNNDHSLDWEVSIDDTAYLNKNTWLNVYEWIEEETKQYNGIEILQMIKDNTLLEGTRIFNDKSEYRYDKDNLNSRYGGFNIIHFIKDQYCIEEYITFEEARKSNKNFKYRNWDEFLGLGNVLYKLYNEYCYIDINKMLDTKGWIVEK